MGEEDWGEGEMEAVDWEEGEREGEDLGEGDLKVIN